MPSFKWRLKSNLGFGLECAGKRSDDGAFERIKRRTVRAWAGRTKAVSSLRCATAVQRIGSSLSRTFIFGFVRTASPRLAGHEPKSKRQSQQHQHEDHG